MSVRPGTRLDGRYRLVERLAYGGMGEVWRASDEVLSREVAVKILRPELAEDEAFVRRFRAEARTTSGLPHNGIAAVFDYGETRVGGDGQSPAPYGDDDADPVAYLVMELVPGEALSGILSREGALGPERTLDLVAQAARALHAAHRSGVIHRDIKPANLMVTPDGRVKVTDFGIARPLDHEPLTATGQVMGTAHYLAPELAKGQDASPLSDVYALGVVAYECLAGHRPFEGDNQVAVALAHLNEQPPPLPATIPEQVRRVVAAAMEKDPQRRMPTAEAFAAALETLRYRQSNDDHLTPGTGIIPGSAAHTGLQAAGIYGATQDVRGWTPGTSPGQDGRQGPASAPMPAHTAGTQRLGEYGAAYAAQAPAGQGYGGQAGQGYGGQGGQGYGGGYDDRGYTDRGYGGSGAPGGYGGYDSGDPFRTPTAPGGLNLPDGPQRERPTRSLSGVALIVGGLVAVLAVVALVVWLTGGNGQPETPIPPSPSSAAPTSQAAPTSAPATHSPSRTLTTTHTSKSATTSTTKSPTRSTGPTTSPSDSLVPPPGGDPGPTTTTQPPASSTSTTTTTAPTSTTGPTAGASTAGSPKQSAAAGAGAAGALGR